MNRNGDAFCLQDRRFDRTNHEVPTATQGHGSGKDTRGFRSGRQRPQPNDPAGSPWQQGSQQVDQRCVWFV